MKPVIKDTNELKPCLMCDSLGTKLLVFDVSDEELNASRIERYCDKCLTRVTATNGIDNTIAVKVDKKSTNSE